MTFDKTIYVASGATGAGALTDTATLTGSDGFTNTANGEHRHPGVERGRADDQQVHPGRPAGRRVQTFTFDVKDAEGNEVATPTVTFGAGETTKSITLGNLAPGTYTVSEDAADGWAPQQTQTSDHRPDDLLGQRDVQQLSSPRRGEGGEGHAFRAAARTAGR